MESAVCWFLLREENRRTRRKTFEAEKRTNTHLWRRLRESNLGLIGERRVQSPQRHPCFLANPKASASRPSRVFLKIPACLYTVEYLSKSAIKRWRIGNNVISLISTSWRKHRVKFYNLQISAKISVMEKLFHSVNIFSYYQRTW